MKVLALVSNHFVSVLQQRPGIVINQNFGFVTELAYCKKIGKLTFRFGPLVAISANSAPASCRPPSRRLL